jgi:glycosyltransferase involved in cell wall biosynthesis
MNSLNNRSGKLRIAIFHTEGTVAFNPGLESIITFLREEGYEVTYWFVESFELHTIVHQAYKVRKLTSIRRKILALCGRPSLHRAVKRVLCRILMGPVSHICVGVDRNGMIYASRYSFATKAPTAFLSYEIYFREEVGFNYKYDEIQACKHISFAVCQDPIRAASLSDENLIPLARIINMPVSPVPSPLSFDQIALNKKELGIEQEFVAIFSGSFAKWTMIDDLLQTINKWPENWAIILRGRAKRDDLDEIKKASDYPNVFIDNTTNDSASFRKILSVANLGLAFYKPLPDSGSAGLNIAKIGLSSGKISTYLSHSVPVICNNIGLYSDLISSYEAGIVVSSPALIPAALSKLNEEALNKMSHAAFRLFSEKLDANLYREQVVAAFSDAISQ